MPADRGVGGNEGQLPALRVAVLAAAPLTAAAAVAGPAACATPIISNLVYNLTGASAALDWADWRCRRAACLWIASLLAVVVAWVLHSRPRGGGGGGGRGGPSPPPPARALLLVALFAAAYCALLAAAGVGDGSPQTASPLFLLLGAFCVQGALGGPMGGPFFGGFSFGGALLFTAVPSCNENNPTHALGKVRALLMRVSSQCSDHSSRAGHAHTLSLTSRAGSRQQIQIECRAGSP